MSSRGAASPHRLNTTLRVETLEDRTTPAFLQNPGVSIAVGDVLAGGGNEIVMGTGAGGGPVVSIFNLAGQQLRSFFAYAPDMRNGVNVALADINGDGSKEILTSPGPGGSAHIKAFDFFGKQLLSFFAYEPSFHGGAQLAGGDLDFDGKAEIVTGSGPGGGPVVRIFNQVGQSIGTILTNEPSFRGGVNVAVGDTTGDGLNEIIAGTGVGGAPLVSVFTPGGTRLGAFFAFDPSDRSGVGVAVGDTDFGGADEIWVTRGPGTEPIVQGFLIDGTKLSSFRAYEDRNYLGGVNLAVGDATRDAIDDVVTVQATGAFAQQPNVFVGQRNLVPQGFAATLNMGFYAADADWTYYFPAGYSNTKRFEIVFAFDDGGNTANGIFGVYDANLKQAADRYGFIIATSKYYRSSLFGPLPDGGTLQMTYDANGNLFAGSGYYTLLGKIRAVMANITNLDTTRIILYGFGEAAGIAHALNFLDPTLADMVIADQGVVFAPSPSGPGPGSGPDWYNYAFDNAATIRGQQIGAGKRRIEMVMQNDNDPAQANLMLNRDGINLYANQLGYLVAFFLPPSTNRPVGVPTDAFNTDVLFRLVYFGPFFARWQAPPPPPP